MSNKIDSDNSAQYTYLWNWLPSRKTITALTAFSALAASVIGITYAYYAQSDFLKDRCSPLNPAADTADTALAEVVNASLTGLGMIATGASTFVQHSIESASINKVSHSPEKQLIIREIRDWETTYRQGMQFAYRCEAPTSNRQNRSEIQLPKNEGLKYNLRLAKELLEETQTTVRFSPNYLARSQQLLEERAKQQEVKLIDLATLSDSSYDCIFKDREHFFLVRRRVESAFTSFRTMAQVAEQTSIGVCVDMAAVALFKGLKKVGWNGRLDFVSIAGGEHSFVVIGREFGSNPEDYKTWGNSAVALDPWAGKVFKLSEIETHLDAYHGFKRSTGTPYTSPFNPKKQLLIAIFGNIDFPEAPKRTPLDAEQTQLFQLLKQKTSQFYHKNHPQPQLVIAKEIYELCIQPSIASFESIMNIRDQAEYFIELTYAGLLGESAD